jgi:hypothetical protein
MQRPVFQDRQIAVSKRAPELSGMARAMEGGGTRTAAV